MDKPNANVICMTGIKKKSQARYQKLESSIEISTCNNIVEFLLNKNQAGNSELVLKVKKDNIQHIGLIRYLENQGVPMDIAQHYFVEIHVFNKRTKEKHRALGFQNEDDGFELISPIFEGKLGKQTISFIRGTVTKPENIHIFKKCMDFIAFLTKLGGKQLKDDAIILHSDLCLKHIKAYIQNYDYNVIYSWMDNDEDGMKATRFLTELSKNEGGLSHKSMNNLYSPYKNIHSWYVQKINTDNGEAK